MDGAGPIAILEAPAGPPGHLEASAGLRPAGSSRALTCLATRIKRPRLRPRPTKIAMEGRVPKGSDGVWALGAAGTNSFQAGGASWSGWAGELADERLPPPTRTARPEDRVGCLRVSCAKNDHYQFDHYQFATKKP